MFCASTCCENDENGEIRELLSGLKGVLRGAVPEERNWRLDESNLPIKGYPGEYPGEDQMSVCGLQLNQDNELVVRHFAREGPSRIVGRVLPVYNGDDATETRYSIENGENLVQPAICMG